MLQYARHSAGRASDASKKTKTTAKSSVVNIVLVEGRNLIPMDDNGLSDPYVKFRLGNEKYKSRVRMLDEQVLFYTIGVKFL